MKKLELRQLIKESISDYLAELNSTGLSEDEVIDETPIKEEKPTMLENNISKDGKIYLVKKAMNESTENDIIEERSLSELFGEGYIGVYSSKEKAMSHGKKSLKERDTQIKENVKTGASKLKELEGQIEDIKMDIKAKQNQAVDEPGMRDGLVADVDSLMAQLSKKEEIYEKLKKALEASAPKKEKKADKKEDKENKDEE